MIEHKVPLANGVFANTVGPAEVIDAMYPAGSTDPSDIYFGPPKVDGAGVYLVAVNSVLRFTDLEGSRRAILGGTVTGKCPVAPSCGNCALAGSGLTIGEMSDRNCARANTAQAFELANQEPRGRFVLLPTSKDAFLVGEDRLTDEYNGGDLMQRRLQSANSVVFTESWLREQGLEQFTVGMNGADGSMGVATASIDSEKIVIAFCSMRQNMGDREPEDQILRQALNAYFDSKGFDGSKRREVLGALDISITLAASASVGYFAQRFQ